MDEYPVKVGSMLFTMVDPNPGFEVAYNRWYERDHFYAGCMIGPWLFAGRRWVAPRELKDLRFPEISPMAEPVDAGSYLSIYWHLEGKAEEHGKWSGPQVWWLYQNGRGFNERTHVHTLMYTRDWTRYRDDDPVPLELALDHDYPGLATVAIERREGTSQETFDEWFRDGYLRKFLAGSPVASDTCWSPIPQREGPMPIPRVERTHLLDLHLFFLDAPAEQSWERFRQLGRDVEAGGLARVVFAAPWLPTLVGSDKYTDELW